MASLEVLPLAKSFFHTGLLGAAGTDAAPSDDQFNRVSFLSHFEGSNDGVNNQFTDASASNHTITANGDVTQGSFGPFARPDGEWGVDFKDGDSLAVASSSDFDFGTSNFTWECFVFQRSRSAFQLIMAQDDYSSGNSISCWLTDTGQASIYYEGGGTHFTTTATVPLNTWTHLAWVRKGTGTNEFSIYINGTAEVSGTMTTSFDQDGIIIGQQANGSYDFIGSISNIRIVNGSAVYTENFTTPTGKLTAVTNTKLLTCQSNRFVDNSASGHTITPAGNAAVTAFGPFLTSSVYDPAVNGASGYFDGTDDLTIPTSSDFNLSNNPFTFSFWANFSSGGTVYGRYNYPSSQRETFISCYDTGVITVRVSPDGTGYYTHSTASGVFGFNQWNYIVVTRTIDGSDSIFKTYVNGTLSATSTFAMTTIYYASQSTYIMNYGPIAERPTGYLCDFKLVNGTATAPNSSNPTAPATNTTNTKLLLNMADGQAIDSAAQNNLTLVGTAKTSTAQKLYGTASLLLDGNSDLVTLPADVGRFSASNAPLDFTIELAFRLAANVGGTPNSIIARWETSGDNRSWMVRMDNVSSENKMKFFDSSTGSNYASTTFSTAFSSETWYQIALVSTSGAVKLYVNGTADSTTHTWTTGVFNAPYDSTALLSIGANVPSNPDNFFNGNIDEVRLSKFARYTSNYTAPTEPFADKGQ